MLSAPHALLAAAAALALLIDRLFGEPPAPTPQDGGAFWLYALVW